MKQDKDKGKKLIRNSTAEFLIFTGQAGEQSIEARYEDETIWLTQQLMAELFQSSKQNISHHIKSIYEEGELQPEATVKKYLTVRQEGKRQVKRELEYYNLDMIISVGYRVNSVRATQFRQWATQVLREFAIKGYVLDKKRMENGSQGRCFVVALQVQFLYLFIMPRQARIDAPGALQYLIIHRFFVRKIHTSSNWGVTSALTRFEWVWLKPCRR